MNREEYIKEARNVKGKIKDDVLEAVIHLLGYEAQTNFDGLVSTYIDYPEFKPFVKGFIWLLEEAYGGGILDTFEERLKEENLIREFRENRIIGDE